MFLYTLNDREKRAFLAIADYAVSIDDETGLGEENLVRMQCQEMGIEYEELDLRDFNLEDALYIFESNQSRKVLFFEICTILFMDHELKVKEKQLLDRIDRYYDFPRDYMPAATDHARKYVQLFFEGRAIISGRPSQEESEN
ncbi:MAG: hypothetical protein K8R90_02350 [Candidatus Cloacimonetes bacterium]|nr:hypothetical protein [Candidatus Cloacimonadota bacterium]